jgi:hypothetical protein
MSPLDLTEYQYDGKVIYCWADKQSALRPDLRTPCPHPACDQTDHSLCLCAAHYREIVGYDYTNPDSL